MDQNNLIEAQTGVRTSYLAFPNCQSAVEHFEVPLSVLLTPYKKIENMQRMDYSPVKCKKCLGVLNPFSIISFQQKTWACNFCGETNQFPHIYRQNLAPGSIPFEMMKENGVIEYIVNSK